MSVKVICWAELDNHYGVTVKGMRKPELPQPDENYIRRYGDPSRAKPAQEWWILISSKVALRPAPGGMELINFVPNGNVPDRPEVFYDLVGKYVADTIAGLRRVARRNDSREQQSVGLPENWADDIVDRIGQMNRDHLLDFVPPHKVINV